MWQKRDDLQKLVRRWLQRVAVYPAKATAQIIPIAGRFPKTLTPGMQRSSAAELLWDSPAGASAAAAAAVHHRPLPDNSEAAAASLSPLVQCCSQLQHTHKSAARSLRVFNLTISFDFLRTLLSSGTCSLLTEQCSITK